jgi:hypothetical protein
LQAALDGARAAAVGESIEFEQNQIVVRDGKVTKSRSTMFPEQLKQLLRHQIEEVKMTHTRSIKYGGGEVYLPG